MSDYIANFCIATALVWVSFIGYRLYFNVPDIEDTTADADITGQPLVSADTPSEVVMEEVYSDAPETPDVVDGTVEHLDALSTPL